MSFVFGPVASRRFGVSLGIDLSPDKKRCNFDCLYCELEKAKTVNIQDNPPPVDAIVAETADALKWHTVDVITLTANGEPTLYPHLDILIDKLQPLKGSAKLLILSNGSTIADSHIAETLSRLDWVKLSLDCASERCFKKLDRPFSGSIDAIIQGMIAFRKRFNGTLIIEILVVAGVNDTDEAFEALGGALRQINPDRVDVGTIERPPAYGVKGVDYAALDRLCKHLAALPVNIIPAKHTLAPQNFDESELLATLQRRAMSEDESLALLDAPRVSALSNLWKKAQSSPARKEKNSFMFCLKNLDIKGFFSYNFGSF